MLIYLVLAQGLAAGAVAVWHPRPRIRAAAARIAVAAAFIALWQWGAW
ncbi:hypothetical protein ACIOC2_01445 [Streptomyces sp. NPDC088337]